MNATIINFYIPKFLFPLKNRVLNLVCHHAAMPRAPAPPPDPVPTTWPHCSPTGTIFLDRSQSPLLNGSRPGIGRGGWGWSAARLQAAPKIKHGHRHCLLLLHGATGSVCRCVARPMRRACQLRLLHITPINVCAIIVVHDGDFLKVSSLPVPRSWSIWRSCPWIKKQSKTGRHVFVKIGKTGLNQFFSSLKTRGWNLKNIKFWEILKDACSLCPYIHINKIDWCLNDRDKCIVAPRAQNP
jgi:hypothetical protein